MIKEEKIEKNQNKEKQIEILLLVSSYECFALSTTGVYLVYHSFYSLDFLNPDKPFNYDDIKKKVLIKPKNMIRYLFEKILQCDTSHIKRCLLKIYLTP